MDRYPVTNFIFPKLITTASLQCESKLFELSTISSLDSMHVVLLQKPFSSISPGTDQLDHPRFCVL